VFSHLEAFLTSEYPIQQVLVLKKRPCGYQWSSNSNESQVPRHIIPLDDARSCWSFDMHCDLANPFDLRICITKSNDLIVKWLVSGGTGQVVADMRVCATV